jgi:hypothetical protein
MTRSDGCVAASPDGRWNRWIRVLSVGVSSMLTVLGVLLAVLLLVFWVVKRQA